MTEASRSPGRRAVTAAQATIRLDFDRIARELGRSPDDELDPCERELLPLVPRGVATVLDVGCGHGALIRQLAGHAASLTGVDLSPEMIRVARERSVGHRNVHFDVIDVGATPPPREHFDVVLCVSTLHHLPFAETVRSLAAAVRPGGRLIVQDLLDRSQWRYAPVNVLAWAARAWPRGRPRRSKRLTRLYAAHGRGERYLTPGEVQPTFDAVLAGVRVRHHLAWRYTAVWERPVVDGLRTPGSGESRSSATPAGPPSAPTWTYSPRSTRLRDG